MKKNNGKRCSFLLVAAMLLGMLPMTAFADTPEQNVLYQGYKEPIDLWDGEVHYGLRIADGTGADGKDPIVYCYNYEKSRPTIKTPPQYQDQDDRCWYTHIDHYLESEDPFVNVYGEEKKQKIALALYAGYPHDAFGLKGQFQITDDEAQYTTQELVWNMTHGREGEIEAKYSFSPEMAAYYNKIYNDVLKDFQLGDPDHLFEYGWFFMDGDYQMKQNPDGSWQTGKMNTRGVRGKLRFPSLPEGMEVRKWNTNIDCSKDGVDVGDSLYLWSAVQPDEKHQIELEYSSERVKFYFYTFDHGGYSISDKEVGKKQQIQNLIRLEPGKDRLYTHFELSLKDGSIKTVNQDMNIEFQEDTAPGEHGSLPDGIVMETEEDTPDGPAPNIPDIPDGPVPDTPDGPVPDTPDGPVPDTPDGPVPDTPDGPVPDTPDGPVPDTPDEPVPDTPDGPAPNAPDRPTPDKPDKPVPDKPDRPAPSTPDRPTPNTPDRPTPNTPDRPTPNTPDRPAPNTPDRPTTNTPDRPAPNTPDISDIPNTPKKPDTPNQPNIPRKVDTPSQLDTPNQHGQPDALPKTHDETHILRWTLLSLLSFGCAVCLLIWGRMRSSKK